MKTIGLLILVILFTFTHAAASPLEEGIKAFARQHYLQAYKQWLPLAGQGHIEAQIFMAVLYRYGLGVKQDLMRAAQWYEKAALQGDVDAQGEIGFFYELGLGVKQDIQAAGKWYEMVEKQGFCLSDTNATGRLNYTD